MLLNSLRQFVVSRTLPRYTARHNLDVQRVFLRLKAAGKNHTVAIVTVERKLIILANVLLRETRLWSETAPAAEA